MKSKLVEPSYNIYSGKHQYNTAVIHVGINDLLKGMPNNVIAYSIYNDILEIALHCLNHNIGRSSFQVLTTVSSEQ